MGAGFHGGFGNTKGSSAGNGYNGYPTKLAEGKQGKHIKTHNNYQPGKSYLSVNMQEAQSLVNDHSGKGQPLSENKERVDFNKKIGTYVDPTSGEEKSTTIGIIHYSKTGAHIVPARPKGDSN